MEQNIFLQENSKFIQYLSVKKYIRYFTDTTGIDSWKSNGIKFDRHYLIENNISFPKKIINLYICYTLGPQLRHLNTNFTLGNCLFVFVKHTGYGT